MTTINKKLYEAMKIVIISIRVVLIQHMMAGELYLVVITNTDFSSKDKE